MIEVGGSLESAGLDFLDGVGEVGGQAALIEDGAFVAARGLSGDGADEGAAGFLVVVSDYAAGFPEV